MAFPLPTDFATLFQREPYQTPALTGGEAFKRAILIVMGTVLAALLLPELPRRPFFHQKPPTEFASGVVLALLVGSYCFYKLVWRPWRSGPPGYRLVGEFEVREKNHLFSKCWVRLAPGKNYQLQLAPELYEQVPVGSRLRLVYTAEGEFVSLARLPQ